MKRYRQKKYYTSDPGFISLESKSYPDAADSSNMVIARILDLFKGEGTYNMEDQSVLWDTYRPIKKKKGNKK